jgi:hypothetical protein
MDARIKFIVCHAKFFAGLGRSCVKILGDMMDA